MKGNIIWFSPQKGYGFLRSSNNESIYFHYTAFSSPISLEVNKELEFDTEPGEKGLKAINIREPSLVLINN